MSVSVELPNGKKRTVRVSPMQVMKSVVEEACEAAGLEGPDGWGLQEEQGRKRVNVDLTVPFRLSGIPRGAKLILVKVGAAALKAKPVTVGLQLPDGSRTQLPLSSDSTLAAVISAFSASVGVDLSQNGPRLGYLTTVVSESQFEATTLSQMGLASGSGLLRLTFEGPAPDLSLRAELPQERTADQDMQDVSAADQKPDQKPDAAALSDNNNSSAGAAVAAADAAPSLAPRVITPEVREAMVDVQDREVDDTFYEHTLVDVQRELASKKRDEGMRNQLLTSKHRDAMKKGAPEFSKTTIRVRFADRMELEGTFHPTNNSVADVVEFIRSALTVHDAEFELFTAPPKTVLDPKLTLKKANLVPLAVVHLSFLSGYPGKTGGRESLKPEFLDAHAVAVEDVRPAPRESAPETGGSASPKKPAPSSKKKSGVPSWFRR